MATRLLGYDDLRAKGIRYSISQINRLIRAGSFPKPVKGAGKSNSWYEDEVDVYIDRLRAARDAAA